jgi:hypothetical protein
MVLITSFKYCKTDYFVLEDNYSEFYKSDSLVEGYKFDSSVNKFTKCDEICQQNQEYQNAFNKLTATDANSLNEVVKSLLQRQIKINKINFVQISLKSLKT